MTHSNTNTRANTNKIKSQKINELKRFSISVNIKFSLPAFTVSYHFFSETILVLHDDKRNCLCTIGIDDIENERHLQLCTTVGYSLFPFVHRSYSSAYYALRPTAIHLPRRRLLFTTPCSSFQIRRSMFKNWLD